MASLTVLLAITVTARALGALGATYVSSWSSAAAVGLAAMFFPTGIAHFVPRRRAGLVAIVPPRLGRPEALVTTTGIIELLGVVMLLIPAGVNHVRGVAAWLLAALLVIMFPANVYAAQSLRHENAPHTPLVQRTVMQGMFIAAAVFVALTS